MKELGGCLLNKAVIVVVILFAVLIMLIVVSIIYKNIKYLKAEKNAKEEQDEKELLRCGLKIGICSLVLVVLIPTMLTLPGFINDSLSIIDKLHPTTSIPATSDIRPDPTFVTATASSATVIITIPTTTKLEPVTPTEEFYSNPSVIHRRLFENQDPFRMTYDADTSGIYGFILDIDSVKNDYRIIIYNAKDEVIKNVSYSEAKYNNYTVNAELIAGQTYVFSVAATEGNPEVKIVIKKPS